MVCAERLELPLSRPQSECLKPRQATRRHLGGFGGFRDRDAHAFNVTLYPLSYEAKTLVDRIGIEPICNPLCKRGKHPKHFHGPHKFGGNGGSRIL